MGQLLWNATSLLLANTEKERESQRERENTIELLIICCNLIISPLDKNVENENGI